MDSLYKQTKTHHHKLGWPQIQGDPLSLSNAGVTGLSLSLACMINFICKKLLYNFSQNSQYCTMTNYEKLGPA